MNNEELTSLGDSYDVILTRMLQEVPGNIDKREGSLIYTSLAPIASQLAETYGVLSGYLDLLLPDTAAGEYLDRIAAQVGLERKPATPAVIGCSFYNGENLVIFPKVETRFACGDAIYQLDQQIDSSKCRLVCETPGKIGNLTTGEMLPLDYVEGFSHGSISELLTPGTDVESDDDLRHRYYLTMGRAAFGGNIADYERQALTLDGIGAVKVFPVFDGPGTVKLFVGGNDNRSVSSERVAAVQEYFMPRLEGAQGTGFAPIGHTVTVGTSVDLRINITAGVTLEGGVTLGQVQPLIEEKVRAFINEIGFNEGTIHNSRLAVSILQVAGVVDVQNIKINNQAGNFGLSKTAGLYQVPIFGSLTLEVV